MPYSSPAAEREYQRAYAALNRAKVREQTLARVQRLRQKKTAEWKRAQDRAAAYKKRAALLGPALLHCIYLDAIGVSVEAIAEEMRVRTEHIARLEDELALWRNPAYWKGRSRERIETTNEPTIICPQCKAWLVGYQRFEKHVEKNHRRIKGGTA